MADHDAAWFVAQRRQMVADQLEARGIADAAVLAAMGTLPRERFVPEEMAAHAYEDRALTIGSGQTISQPYIVARMTQALELWRWPDGVAHVLDVGTGSGYQAAVLAAIGARVVSVERDGQLAIAAARRLAALHIGGVEVVEGDGSEGWPAGAPYAGIVVGAAAPGVPAPLEEQLAEGGRLVLPIGTRARQDLTVVARAGGRLSRRVLEPCVFVPLLGRWGFVA